MGWFKNVLHYVALHLFTLLQVVIPEDLGEHPAAMQHGNNNGSRRLWLLIDHLPILIAYYLTLQVLFQQQINLAPNCSNNLPETESLNVNNVCVEHICPENRSQDFKEDHKRQG
ncbi:unnamed protein product [Allacma fusca]|uniref:Uncharacterized protein n=1 Tax=Allacma fusca TaxID=39272 RepID=A0A8J2K8S9_9HEXA|nr:unnamed protein product [Allacma fusca]